MQGIGAKKCPDDESGRVCDLSTERLRCTKHIVGHWKRPPKNFVICLDGTVGSVYNSGDASDMGHIPQNIIVARIASGVVAQPV